MLGLYSSAGGTEFPFSPFSSEEEKDGLEIVMFTEKGRVWPGGRVSDLTEGRLTQEEIENCDMRISMWYGYPTSITYEQDYEAGKLTYTDYIGFIIKKNGCVVSASLYKIYGFTQYKAGLYEEVCHINYPFLNCFVTEMHVKSELRKIALIDRIVTLNSETNRQSSPYWEEWTPEY